MAKNPSLFKRLTEHLDREPLGIYWDRADSRFVGVGSDGTEYEVPLAIASQARGDILRRGADTWERLSAKTAGAPLVGDGTDLVVANTPSLLSSINEYRKQRCFVNFLKQPAVSIQAKNTMAIVTAANAQQDFFWVDGNYFELAQGVGLLGANTLLAAVGLTPGAGGWLLTCDDLATDSIELTRGIVSGSAQSFIAGTDAFYLRCAFLVGTRANITHLKCGFRNLAAYETASTQAETLAAYDDKAMVGINNNAGRLGRCTSKATTDAELNAAHAAAADADVLALEVSISAALAVTCKIGHATPAAATYAGYEAARAAAIADLAVDATIEGTAHSCTTAIEHVPSIILGASGAGAPDVRLMSFDCGYSA